MELRNQKGINIITLSVAIIILVIISSVLVYSSKDGVKIRNLKDMYNDIELLDNKISAYYAEHGDLPKLDTPYTNTSFLNNANYEEVNPNNGDIYYVIDLKQLEGISLNYGRDYEIVSQTGNTVPNVNDYSDLYIVNEASHTVYYPKGINVNGTKYHTYGEEWKKVDMSIIPIETAEQLAKVGSGDQVTVGGIKYTFTREGTYVLKNDIDLSGVCHKVDGTTENDISWTPLCRTQETAFTGKFYGNGHEIRGLYINKNLAFQSFIGFNKGTIQDIEIRGEINSENTVIGVIAGKNDGNIVNCNSRVSITGTNFVGGIAGHNYSKIINCRNYGKVTGTLENSEDGAVGGIVGLNVENGIIEKSYNEGNVIGKSNCIGGIAGKNKGIINLCVNNSQVASNRNNVGGIVGYQYDNNETKTVNCYNMSSITSILNVGGINGSLAQGQILSCYSIGTIGGTTNIKSVIGERADNDTIVRNNFYLNTIPTTDENATPKSMADMKSQSFVDLLNQGQSDQPWSMDTKGINDGYPVLKWQLEELK